jgi:hypothetical protein
MLKSIENYLSIAVVSLRIKKENEKFRIDVIMKSINPDDDKAGSLIPFSVINTSLQACSQDLEQILDSTYKSQKNRINQIEFINKQLEKIEQEKKEKGNEKGKQAKKKPVKKKEAPKNDLFAQGSNTPKKEEKKPEPVKEAPEAPKSSTEKLKESIIGKSGIPKENLIVGTPGPISPEQQEQIKDSFQEHHATDKTIQMASVEQPHSGSPADKIKKSLENNDEIVKEMESVTNIDDNCDKSPVSEVTDIKVTDITDPEKPKAVDLPESENRCKMCDKDLKWHNADFCQLPGCPSKKEPEKPEEDAFPYNLPTSPEVETEKKENPLEGIPAPDPQDWASAAKNAFSDPDEDQIDMFNS